MKELVLLFNLILLPILMAGQKTVADPRLKGIDAEMEKVLDTWDAPGFSVAVVDRNKVIYAKGFGYRDYGQKLPATPNTLYAIGSCSKAFTAGLLGILQGEGKLDLSDSPRKYIPELEFYNDELNNQVDIRDIITHRTGIPRHDFAWYLFPAETREELVKRIAHHEPFAGLRQRWYYNNFMYLLQGVIAERITGKSWEENMREHFFIPLDMQTANTSIDELEDSSEPAVGYVTDDEGLIEKTDYYRIATMGPAGSINSSVNEMANWLKVWIHGGKYGDQEILPASYVSEAISPQMVMGGGAPDDKRPELHFSTYGYGWMCSSYKGHYRVQHGGNIDGFSANTCFFPSDSIGIVVLVNQNGSSIPSVVRNILADRLLGVTATDWNQDLHDEMMEARQNQQAARASADDNRKKGTTPSHPLAEYAGTYAHPGYGNFELAVERDSLFALFPLKKYWLKHYHYDVFQPFEVKADGIEMEDPSEILLNFLTHTNGDIASVRMQIEPALEDPIEFKHTPKTIDVEKSELERYTGEYELMGTTAKVYTKGETLFLFVAGQPEYELLATGEHQFSIKSLSGYKLEFHPGKGQRIEAVSFIQPNGTFKATRK